MAVTGGALSLIAATVPSVPVDQAAAALRLTSEDPEDGADGWDREDADDSDDRDSDDDDVERRPSVVPVRLDDSDDDSDDSDDDFDEDLESVKRAEAEAEKARRRADEERARAEAARQAREDAEKARAGCDGLKTGGLGAVKSHVREAASVLGCRFGKPTMFGVAGRGGPSDHPGGLAVDFMVNRATGDALAQCALNNMEALGVKYVIWEQQINFGDGWRPMEDRGGVTANHFDHVHVSFERTGGEGELRGC